MSCCEAVSTRCLKVILILASVVTVLSLASTVFFSYVLYSAIHEQDNRHINAVERTSTPSPPSATDTSAQPARTSWNVTSLEFSRNVTIAQLKNDVLSSNKAILSVRDGRLLAGQKGDTKLFIYSAVSGAYMNTTRLPFTYPGNTVYDAVWTRNGNIVYTTRENGSKVNTVEVMALNGTLIRSTNLSRPRYLSVSANGIIYLADANNGVYQSADNGVTWYHKFSIDSTRYGYQTVNVQNSRSATDEFWIVAYHSSNRWYYWYLDVYTDNGDYIASTPNYRSLSTIKDPSFSKFAHDGHETMFLLDYINGTVHALSTVTRAYDRPLLTSRHFTNNYPVSLSVDVTRDNNVLYVGLSKYGLVSVYTLQYR